MHSVHLCQGLDSSGCSRSNRHRLNSIRTCSVPFWRNNFLFLLQSLHKLEMIEKHNSLIFNGLSLSCWRNSIKLSMTPSSLIFSL
jgi:hypothetical protein